VPYYRDLSRRIDGRLTEKNAVALLGELPVLTKTILRSQTEYLRSDSPRSGLVWNTSGGSTGEPVRFLQDRAMRRAATVNKLLFMRWLGFKPGEHHLLVWGVPQETFGEATPLRERVYRIVHNQTYLDCYQLSSAVMEEWLALIERRPPSIIEAYADALAEFSEYLLSRGRRVPTPRGIIASAGVLTDRKRDLMTRAFGCPVLNRYGSREVGDVACSCTADHAMHVCELTYYVELVDDDGNACSPGMEGNVLVTLFSNLTMPLIRYRIQDRAIWADGPCRCGRTSRRLLTVLGRENDYLVAGDGTRINGTALTTLLYGVDGILRFQYIQKSRDTVTLAVAPQDGASQQMIREELRAPMERLVSLLGGCRVELTFVRDIEPCKSGKYRYVINQLGNSTRQ
jgi:phenylacetate-CoA ligase